MSQTGETGRDRSRSGKASLVKSGPSDITEGDDMLESSPVSSARLRVRRGVTESTSLFFSFDSKRVGAILEVSGILVIAGTLTWLLSEGVVFAVLV